MMRHPALRSDPVAAYLVLMKTSSVPSSPASRDFCLQTAPPPLKMYSTFCARFPPRLSGPYRVMCRRRENTFSCQCGRLAGITIRTLSLRGSQRNVPPPASADAGATDGATDGSTLGESSFEAALEFVRVPVFPAAGVSATVSAVAGLMRSLEEDPEP